MKKRKLFYLAIIYALLLLIVSCKGGQQIGTNAMQKDTTTPSKIEKKLVKAISHLQMGKVKLVVQLRLLQIRVLVRKMSYLKIIMIPLLLHKRFLAT